MERVTAVRALPTYRLEIEFSDGVRGVLDYEDRLFGPMMEPLRDPARFAPKPVSTSSASSAGRTAPTSPPTPSTTASKPEPPAPAEASPKQAARAPAAGDMEAAPRELFAQPETAAGRVRVPGVP